MPFILLISVAIALFAAAARPAASPGAASDAVWRFQALRQRGCDGQGGYEAPLAHLDSLDTAARRWASGETLAAAIDQAGYSATQVSTLHVLGADDGARDEQDCRALRNPAFRHFGLYRGNAGTWIILAAPAYPGTPRAALWHALPTPVSLRAPSARQAPQTAATPIGAAAWVDAAQGLSGRALSARVLSLVNAARGRGRRCGSRYFPAVASVQPSVLLDAVASQHAADMARRGYFEHVDLQGRSPADRVKAAGYRERLVGENIAYGPTSAEEVVAGWLTSPGHCENIMDPRFAQMGLALASGAARPFGAYWDQLLVEPASAGIAGGRR